MKKFAAFVFVMFATTAFSEGRNNFPYFDCALTQLSSGSTSFQKTALLRSGDQEIPMEATLAADDGLTIGLVAYETQLFIKVFKNEKFVFSSTLMTSHTPFAKDSLITTNLQFTNDLSDDLSKKSILLNCEAFDKKPTK